MAEPLVLKDFNLLHPTTKEKLETLLEQCRPTVKLLCYETWRSAERQDWVYAQKQSQLKSPNGVHQWYHAFDIVPLDANGAAVWASKTHEIWKNIAAIGESLGLEWGGRWSSMNDPFHFQDKAFLLGSTSASKLVAKYGTPEKYKATWGTVEPSTPSVKIPPTLKNGARGDDVKNLQTLLNKKLGTAITPLVADGIFGAKTLEAVKWYQTVNKLAVDGIVGKNTWTALLS